MEDDGLDSPIHLYSLQGVEMWKGCGSNVYASLRELRWESVCVCVLLE